MAQLGTTVGERAGVPGPTGTGTRRRTAVLTALVASAVGLGLAGCAPAPEGAMDVIYLPEGTPRLKASEQRAAQLRTGSYVDDIPEYTGAPGIDANWPAYVPRLHTMVYRAEDVRIRRD